MTNNSLEIKYESFNNFIINNNITQTDMLYLISNYLLDNTQSYLDKDIILKNVLPDTQINFKDYDEIRNYSIFNSKSNAFQIAEVAHQLLFINNRINKQEQKHYSD